MNYQKLTGACLSILLTCATLHAQTTTKIPLNEPDHNKPKLFTSLPDRIPVEIQSIKSFFSATKTAGKEISLGLASKDLPAFRGTVISSVTKYGNKVHSVVVRSTDFKGATLTLSSSTNPDGTVAFTGRIISFQHGDLYELQQQGELYFLVKRNFYDLVNE